MSKKKREQEHLELIEALKNEKKKYEIHLQGYGGEFVLGSITKEQYEFWKDRDDLDDFAYDWDGEMDIPEAMKIFNPGDWHECDNLEHISGCEFSELCSVVVYDKEGNEVWSSPLSVSALEDRGVGVDGMNRDEFYVEHDSTEEYFFAGQNFEKGTFQTYEIETYGKFDPAKLNFSTNDVNGWEFVDGVSYESIELDDTSGYSTTGKGSEYKVHKIER